MVHTGWSIAAVAAAAAAAASRGSSIAAVVLAAVSALCALVAFRWHSDGVAWKIKVINAVASCIWPLSGLRQGKLNRKVFETLSLYKMTRRTPAPACDSRGVLRRDILVPRLSGVPVQDGNASRIQIRLYQLQKQQQQQQQLIMYLHGGGFTVSHVDSAEYDSLCAKLARRGFTVASVEYGCYP
jgi:acetyl esterase/lipase